METTKLALTVPEAAEAIGVSERNMYSLIHSHGFPVKRIGGKYVIPVKGLEKWLMEGDETEWKN